MVRINNTHECDFFFAILQRYCKEFIAFALHCLSFDKYMINPARQTIGELSASKICQSSLNIQVYLLSRRINLSRIPTHFYAERLPRRCFYMFPIRDISSI